MAHGYLFSALSEAKPLEKEAKKKKDSPRLLAYRELKTLSLEESPLYDACRHTSLDATSSSGFPLHSLLPVKPSKKWKKKGSEQTPEEVSKSFGEVVDTTAYAQSIGQFQALRSSFEQTLHTKESHLERTSSKSQGVGNFSFPLPHVHESTQGMLSLHPSSYGNILFSNEGQIVFDEKKTQADLRRAAPIFQSFLQNPQKVLFYSATQQISYSLALWAAMHWNQSLLAGKWIGGSLTNWAHIVESKKRAAQLQSLVEYGKEKSEYSSSSSPHSSHQDKYFSHTRKTGFYQSYRVGPTKPDLLFVFEASASSTALKEARTHGIPTMGFSCGKISSKLLTYPISCTEENQSLLSLYLFFLASFSSSSFSSSSFSAKQSQRER